MWDAFLKELGNARYRPDCVRIFSHCQGLAPDADLVPWMKQHSIGSAGAANYVNWLGRTVQQVREEAVLY